MNRRAFVSLAAGAACARAQEAPLVAQPLVPLDLHRLSSKLFSITGNGATMVAALGSEGLLLVDSGLAEHGALLAATLQERIAQVPVRMVINTHWHHDHTGGNAALGAAGTAVVASENTKRHLERATRIEFLNQTFAALPKAGIPKRALPAKGDRVVFGQIVAEVWPHPPAHTDGDLYVFFPNQNVLAAGDLFFEGQYPTIDYSNGGHIEGMVAAHEKLARVADEKTQIIPGHGRPCGLKEVRASLEMLSAVVAKLRDFAAAGLPVGEAVNRKPTQVFDAQFAQTDRQTLAPDAFVRIAYESLRRERKFR